MLSWTWNNTLTFAYNDLSIEIGFTSNGQHFDSLSFQKIDEVKYFGYCNGTTCTLAYEINIHSTSGTWINSSFKNITFDTLPNEQLMSILSAHATVNKNISKVEKKQISKFYNDEIINKVNLKFKEIGFKYVTLDLNGYKMGSMN